MIDERDRSVKMGVDEKDLQKQIPFGFWGVSFDESEIVTINGLGIVLEFIGGSTEKNVMIFAIKGVQSFGVEGEVTWKPESHPAAMRRIRVNVDVGNRTRGVVSIKSETFLVLKIDHDHSPPVLVVRPTKEVRRAHH